MNTEWWPPMKLTYFASNGLGENLCQTPAIRYFAKTGYEVTVVCPDNCVVLFEGMKHIKEVTPWSLAGFKEYGDGTFHTKFLDKDGAWSSGHYTHWNGNGMIERFPQPKMDYISAYLTRIFGEKVVKTMGANDFVMDAPWCPNGGTKRHPMEVVIFEGSAEPVRRLPSEAGTKLYSLLKKRGYVVGYFTAGDRGNEAFWRINSAIERASLVVTPDSGPLHLALAKGANVLALPTRELAENIVNPLYYPQTHVWTMREPVCDLQCQGARYQEANGIHRGYRRMMPWPKGIEGREGYPQCLNCWGKKAPCLDLSDKDVLELADTITSILEHGHGGRVPTYSSPQGAESSPVASTASEQPLIL